MPPPRLPPFLARLTSPEARSNVLWGLFFLGLFARVAFLGEHPLSAHLYSDMSVYDMRAEHFFAREATPWDTFTPLGYPAFLAIVYRFTGRAHELVGGLQAVMGAATGVLTMLVGEQVGASARTARLSGLLVALYPPLILYTGLLLTETPSAFLLMLFVWLLLRARRAPTWRHLALTGLTLSVGMAVRPNFVLTLPVVAWLAWVSFDRRQALRFVGGLVLSMLPVLLLATAHNARLVGKPTLGTNGGLNFYLAHAEVPGAAFVEDGYTHRISPIPNLMRHRDKAVFVSPVPFYDEGYFYRKGLAELASRPSEVLTSLDNVVEGVGLGRQGFWPGWPGHGVLLAVIGKAFAGAILIPALTCGGFLLARRRRRRASVDGEGARKPSAKATGGGGDDDAGRLLLLGLCGSTLVTMYLFLGDPRVRVPFDPLFVILGIEAWTHVLALLRRRAARRGGSVSA